ncbi:MAG TPA: PQQ-binding-like beta-propeller repeat protein [Steroidobacteraceae bacterium]|nr:PQQ-binding-like beta-propeller repeat protein [Steroidobacteraceae bacterium]
MVIRYWLPVIGAISVIGLASSAIAASSSGAQGAARAAPADWPAYNRTVGGDRYSPLRQINRANVSKLKDVCTYELPELTAFQTGPVVVDGTMYFTTAHNSYAIDAVDCHLKWMQPVSSKPGGLGANRGFAYLDGMLFRGTPAGHVIALSAADGHQIWDHSIDVADTPGVSIPMAPIAADGRVYVGNASGDNVGVTGHVYALDAHDGHLLWKFDVVGPAVRSTWTNAKLPITGGAFWTSFTFDQAKGVLYVPAGNPAPDFDSLDRTGDDLYSDSVIALDGASGRMLGYHQLVRHDNHDWDVNSAPMLATTRTGREIIASANKDGLLSILDRSAVGGSTSAASANASPPVIPLLSQTPTTTRTNVNVPLSSDRTVHFCPGIGGGSEWNGAAYSPQTDSLFVGAVDQCVRVRLQRPLAVPPAGQIWFASSIPLNQMTDPASGATGWLTAFNAENGRVRWKFHAPHPMLAGVTPTAGGLVFAADLGGTVYAVDQRSGHVLWTRDTGQAIGGGIVSYAVDGHQRIAVAAGMRSQLWTSAASASRIVVYGLH